MATVEDFRTAGKEASVSFAISKYMIGYEWLSKLVTFAILAGFSSVILVMLLGQSRVFYSMSRDGLVPKMFSDVHPKYQTPYKSKHALLRVHLDFCRIHSGRYRRRNDEHRHVVRVHSRLRRRLDPARAPAGNSRGIQNAVGARSLHHSACWCVAP